MQFMYYFPPYLNNVAALPMESYKFKFVTNPMLHEPIKLAQLSENKTMIKLCTYQIYSFVD